MLNAPPKKAVLKGSSPVTTFTVGALRAYMIESVDQFPKIDLQIPLPSPGMS
jgi:hypothetical protein